MCKIYTNTNTKIQIQIKIQIQTQIQIYKYTNTNTKVCSNIYPWLNSQGIQIHIQIQIQKFAYVDPQRGDINSDDGGDFRNFGLSVSLLKGTSSW